jgi:hypothetical protein
MTFVPPDCRASAGWKMPPAALPVRPDVRFGMLDGLLDVGIAFNDSTHRPIPWSNRPGRLRLMK